MSSESIPAPTVDPGPPDVILAKMSSVAAGSGKDKLLAIKAKYAPIFKCERVGVIVGGGADDGYGYTLLPHPHGTNPHPCLTFPTGHDRAGESRYRWEDQPGGDRHGWFKDDDARQSDGRPAGATG